MESVHTYILTAPDLELKSAYASRCRKFFKRHPKALSIFISNLDSPPSILYSLLLEAGIRSPKGQPYSLSTIGVIKQFLHTIEVK